MIDFWEAIGRIATYEDLNSQFLELMPQAMQIPHVTTRAKKFGSVSVGLDIPGEQYEKVQNFFAPILTENYLSLMSAGELIFTYSFQESRDAMQDLLKITSNLRPKVFGPSTKYFITLGVLIVDEIFRHNLRDKGTSSLKVIRRLSDPENDQITELAKDTKFETAATAFSQNPWDGGCHCRLIYWEGHLHPLAIDKVGGQSDWEPSASAEENVKSSAA